MSEGNSESLLGQKFNDYVKSQGSPDLNDDLNYERICLGYRQYLEIELEDSNKQLEDMRGYTRHKVKCMYGFQGDKWRCTCGLKELLKKDV